MHRILERIAKVEEVATSKNLQTVYSSVRQKTPMNYHMFVFGKQTSGVIRDRQRDNYSHNGKYQAAIIDD